ncbi:MAG: hypothetical protein EHM28_14610, partial [Spirochaetaceae bacterium]
MKIRTKFLLLICFIILSFTAIVVFDLLYSNEIAKLILLKDQGYNAITNLYTLNIETRGLLYSQSLDLAFREWKNNAVMHREAINNFLNSEYLLVLVQKNHKIAASFRLTLDNWNYIQAELEQIREKIDSNFSDELENSMGIYFIMEQRAGDMDVLTTCNLTDGVVQYLTGAILDYFTTINQEINTEAGRIETIYAMIKYVMIGCLIVVILAVFYFFLRSFSSRLQKMESILKSVSERDFSQDFNITGKDEIAGFAEYIRLSVHNLKDIFSKIKIHSNRTSALSSSVTSELSNSSKSLDHITDNIKSIKNDFENLNNNITTSSRSSTEIQQNLNLLSEQMQTQATTIVESSASIEEIIASINNISKVVQARRDSALNLIDEIRSRDVDMIETDVKIQDIHKNMEKIQEVISIINGIAGQINLLSLNAAIEAAHAGDSGKGFAIVADEIRKLAESTNSNSKQIGSYVSQITNMIQETSEVSNKSLAANKTTVDEVVRFAQLFEEISG